MQRGLTEKDRRRSASNESKALLDVVSKLRAELLQSQVERQKLQDQLQCMIYLVRRAWQGDEIASMHIANIVGMAPPKIEKSSDFVEATSTPKLFSQSRALNGWVRLVIGLLNRMYRKEELELRAKQLLHLRQREELLDEQLMTSNNEAIQRQNNISAVQLNTLELLRIKEEEEARQRQEQREQLERQRQDLQTQLKRRKPPISHLYGQGQYSKDGAEREAKLHVSKNFLITAVGRREECCMPNVEGTAHANGFTQGIDERTTRSDASIFSRVDSEKKSSEDVFQDRRRTSLSSHDNESLTEDKNDSRHVRSQTCHGTGKRAGSHSRPRPKTAAVVTKTTSGSSGLSRKHARRPASAHLSPCKSSPAFDTSKTKRQLDLIERDLKLTTKALQDRLGISKPGLV